MQKAVLYKDARKKEILNHNGRKHRFVMVIDLRKCMGCKSCTVSCSEENNVLSTNPWNVVMDMTSGSFPNYKRTFLPRPCMHCEDAPCVSVCPTGSSYKSEDTGIVGIKQDICIGCRSCITACPYEARVFNWKTPEKSITNNPSVPKRRAGVVEKCTFCLHKIEPALKEGKQIGTTRDQKDNKQVVSPSCITSCPPTARIFGDLNDKNSEVYEILENNEYYTLVPEANTRPNVFYLQ